MVYGFVKQSGGHVKIYSEVGQGTTVKVYLPRSLADEDREVVVQDGPIVGGSETVLVVEDDDEVRSTVVETLTDLGYRVLTARDAQAGLTVAESGVPIDVIFTDVVMPGPLKSSEMARRAKERLPNLAVLFTSGYTENSIVHGGKLDAGVELLSKPYTREALARRLRHVLANQKQRAEANKDRAYSHDAIAKLRTKPAMRVLLVEDDDLIRMNTTDILLEGGHMVVEAANATQAIDLIDREDIDVLVTDVGLPDMSGADLSVLIKERKPSVGVVFATGDNFLPSNAPAGSVLLCKPYTESDVRLAIVQAMSE